MIKDIRLHGFRIQYEENAYDGIKYLRDELQLVEAKVFFDQARMKKFAEFEDRHDRQFTLTYHDGIYMLIRR